MSGKRKKPLHKRFFSRRVKSGGGHKAFVAVTAVLGLIVMMFGFVGTSQAAPGDVCPEGDGWTAHINVNAQSYTYTPPEGYEVVESCYKAGDTVVFGTSATVTSSVWNKPECTEVGPGCNYQNISHASFRLEKKTQDACPDLPGDQPMGTDCTQPNDDRETRDLPGVVDCQEETYTVEHQERTREYSWDGDSWEPGPWSDWTTYDTTVTPATDEQCPDETQDACPDLPGDQPMGTDCTQPNDDRETRDLPGVVDCQEETYTVEHQERTREYSWDGDSWEPGPWSDWTTYDTTVTPATDEQCPDEEEKVTICHATSAVENPYVVITVSVNAVDGVAGNSGNQSDHYGEHQGPIFDPAIHENGDDWGDIIPPVPPHHTGLNWSAEGQAIYDAGCKAEDDEQEPEGNLNVTSNCESITFSSSGVKPEDAEVVFKLDGVVMAPGTYPVTPGSHTVELFVDGEKVDSETVTVAECEDGQVTPAGFTLINPTCAADGSLLIPAQPEGVQVTPAPGTYGPGSYNVVFTAEDGFVLTTNPSGTVTVLAATGYQDEDKSSACYVEREPDVRETSSERENCRLGGVETTHAVYTTSYSFNEETQQWESSETATSSLSFEPYTAAELREKGCVKGPDNNPDNPVTPTSNTPTTADTGLWTEEPASKNGSALWGMAAALVLMSLGFLGYGARRRGQES